MAWAGWGAGPSGAGSAGGPSRWFQAALLVVCVVCTVIMALTRNWPGAAVGLLASAWFFARVFLGLGRPKGDEDEPRGPPGRAGPPPA